VWFYAVKFVLPVNQAFLYPRWEIRADQPLAWAALAGAILAPVLLWALRRRIGAGPLTAVLVYGIMLAPASGIFDVYFFRYSFVQAHFQYFACAAAGALAGAALATAVPRGAGRVVLASALVATLGAISFGRMHIYADSETLWRDTIARNPAA